MTTDALATATTRGHGSQGKVLVPEVVSNVCFGGLKKNRLYICGTTSLYALLTRANGAQKS